MAKRLNPLKNAVRAAPANFEDFRKIARKNFEDSRYLICTKDYAKEGNIIYLPAYLAFLR